MNDPLRRLVALACMLLVVPAVAMPLEEALTAAESNDGKLAAALAQGVAAAENVTLARSRLLPQVAVQGTVQRLQQSSAPLNAADTASSDFEGRAENLQLTLRQALVRPRDMVGLAIGDLQARIGELDVAAARSRLHSRTVGIWADAIAAHAIQRIQRQLVRAFEEAAEQASQRLLRGDGTRDALAEAQAQLGLARAQLIEADLNVKARLQALKQHTGREPSRMDDWQLPPVVRLQPPFPTLDEAVQTILQGNPEAQGAAAAAELSGHRIRQARADHLPTIDLVASSTRSANDTSDTLGSRLRSTRIGVQVSIPLYTGGGLSAASRQAQAGYDAAEAEHRAVQQQLEQELIAAWATQAGLHERLAAASAMISAAREQRMAAQMALKAGVGTRAEVARAEILVAQREAEQVTQTVELVKAITRIVGLLPPADAAWMRWTASLSAGTATLAH